MPETMFVGGCVRDLLLGKTIKDWDLATTHKPEAVMALLKKGGVKAIPTGLAHGTVTAVFPNIQFQVTTLRKDVETDGRHAVVRFSDSWVEDAERRDFTINTLLMDAEGNIYDPVQTGFDDLQKGRIRFVGKASQRIKEDYLRILRFFRFNATHGTAKMDKDALAACVRLRAGLTKLSKERVTMEIIKLLAGAKAATVLRVMKENKILPWLTGDFVEKVFVSACHARPRAGIHGSPLKAGMTPLLCIASLANFKKPRLQKIIANMALSREQTRTLEHTLDAYLHLKKNKLNDKTLFFIAQTYGADNATYAVQLAGGSKLHIQKTKKFAAKKFPLSGQDFMARGYKAGAELGKVLHKAKARWIESVGKLPRQRLLER